MVGDGAYDREGDLVQRADLPDAAALHLTGIRAEVAADFGGLLPAGDKLIAGGDDAPGDVAVINAAGALQERVGGRLIRGDNHLVQHRQKPLDAVERGGVEVILDHALGHDQVADADAGADAAGHAGIDDQ